MVVDIRYLRHFLAVADELNFARAAQRLNMAQPPLSQSIRRLEKWLDVRLFDRSNRGTKLTKAGAALIEEARSTIHHFEHAVATARKVGGGSHDPVAVGFVTAGILRLLPAAIRSYRRQFPDAQVQLLEGATNDLLDAIQHDKLDLALVHPPHRLPAGLVIEDLQREHPVAAVPRFHPLADRSLIALKELAREPLIFFPRLTSPDLHQRILDAFKRQGLKPRIEHEARLTPTILSFVSAGLGYALVPESARALAFADVVFRPVKDLPADLFWSLSLAWKPAVASQTAHVFAATLRAIAGLPLHAASEERPRRSARRRRAVRSARAAGPA